MLMPELDLSKANLTPEEMAIAARTLNKGRLRASKPKKEDIYEHNGFRYRRNLHGESAYVWRMLCFALVAAHPHSCIPVTADFDVGDLTMTYEARRDRCKELDLLVKKIEDTVQSHRKAGLLRWHQAIHGELPPGIKEDLPGFSYMKA